MIVLLDLDSTIYNLTDPTLAYLSKKVGHELNVSMIDDWEWYSRYGLHPEEFWNLEGTFLNLKPYPWAVEAITKVSHWGVRQVFFSTIISKCGAWEKMQAVDRDFPFIGSRNLLMTGGVKDLARGDVLVDDGPHNLHEFIKAGGVGVLADMHGAPYCTFPSASATLRNWRDYPKLLKDLEFYTIDGHRR